MLSIVPFKKMRTKLKKFCHHSKCKKTKQCPQNHEHCRNELNGWTAIAWTLSAYLKTLIDIKTVRYLWPSGSSCRLHRLLEEVEKLDTILEFLVFMTHLHENEDPISEQIKELSRLIDGVYYVLDDFKNDLSSYETIKIK